MKIQSFLIRNCGLLLFALLAFPFVRLAAQTQPENAAPVQTPAAEKQSNPQSGLTRLPRNEEGGDLVEEGPEFLKLRFDWFFQPRAFPLGFIPQGARERALQQKKQMYQREGRFSLLTTPGAGGFVVPPTGTSSAWFSIGPTPTSTPVFGPFTSGRVTALAVNPNNKDNAYLGGADGGLWVTTDGGTTWTALAATENPPNAGLPTIAVGALAVDPLTCSASICTTVYVGTGEDNFAGDNVYGEGVLKCTVTAGTPPTATCTQDSTFHSISPLTPTRGGPGIGAIAVNRASGRNNLLLAAVKGLSLTSLASGIWCSADSGTTWSRVLPVSAAASDPGTDVAFGSDGTAWVALGFTPGDPTNNGIYKSTAPVTSCTITFTKQVLPAALSSNIGRITLALAPSSNTTLYAAIANSATSSTTLLGVAVTTNGGSTPWTQLNGDPRLSTRGICNSQCFYDIPLAVSPASASDVFFGGAAGNGTLIRSTNGGASWTEISRNDVANAPDSIHVDMHAIAFSSDGSRMYVGNDGGVWRTDTPTAMPAAGFWKNLNQNLNITQFYPGVSIHPANTGFSMGGTQDNDVQIYQGSHGTPAAWQSAEIGCDGGFTAIDFNIPSTSYGECEYIPNRPPFPLILVTFNGDGILGHGFLANAGIDPTDRGSFIPPLVMDPNTSTTLYFATCRVWASTDGANSWNAISPDVTTPAHPAGCTTSANGVLSSVAAVPGNSNTIYVGSNDGDVEVTADGGATWNSIANSLPLRSVTQVAVDPTTATTAYATFSGFGTCANAEITCDGKGHVFMTSNGTAGAGTTWTDISIAPFSTTALPDIPVNGIVVDPADATHKTLYVGTDIGAFFTIDGGKNWSPLGAIASLPNAQILSLTLHNASRTLRAATHGRGVWDLSLGAGAFGIASISPFTANAGAASITNFTVTGSGFTANSVIKFAVNGTTTSLTTNCPTSTSCTGTIPAAQLQTGGAASVTVTNTAPAGTTNAVPFTILSPIPVIVTINPTTATTVSTNFSLTVNGSSITCGTNGTIVLFNGSPRTNVTACSAGSLTVTLPNSDFAVPAVVPIDLFTPPPGGGPDTNGNPPTLTITQGSNPAPTITTIMPATASSGSPAFLLTVNGTNFVSGATLSFSSPEGADPAIATTFVNSTQLTATIQAADIDLPGNATVIVNNLGPGGGPSNSVNFTITLGTNPVPRVVVVTPTSAASGGPQFTLALVGAGFAKGAVVNFNGKQEATTVADSGDLSAVIPAADIATPGTVPVTVTNPAPGGGTSTPAFNFQIQMTNPLPTVSSLMPNNTLAGGPGFMLTVNGTNFVQGHSVVNFNGVGKATTFVSSTQLMATILASDIATAGTFRVDVSTDPPGGGTSTPEVMFTVNNPVPTVTSINPTNLGAGGAAFTLMVTGTNFVSTSVVNFNGAMKATTFTIATQLTASILAADVATAGMVPVTVTNPAPGGGTSAAAVTFTVNPKPSFTMSATAALPSPVSAGSSGTSTITVTPSNGFTGTVVITCTTLPPGVNCPPTPASINVTGTSPAMGPLVVSVMGPSTSMMASTVRANRVLSAGNVAPSSGGKGWWMLSGGTGLAALVLLILPGRKRYRTALGLGLVCVLSFTLGCGGGSSGGGITPPTQTTTQLTVSTTKVASNGSITVTASVANVPGTGPGATATQPGGTVTFFADGTAVGTAAPLTGGSTGQITVTAAMAPQFLPLVGTHSLVAKYSGDGGHSISQSGTLNIAVTGTTQVAITGTSGTTMANGTVSLTIN
jgi:hypothetical protein